MKTVNRLSYSLAQLQEKIALELARRPPLTTKQAMAQCLKKQRRLMSANYEAYMDAITSSAKLGRISAVEYLWVKRVYGDKSKIARMNFATVANFFLILKEVVLEK